MIVDWNYTLRSHKIIVKNAARIYVIGYLQNNKGLPDVVGTMSGMPQLEKYMAGTIIMPCWTSGDGGVIAISNAGWL